MNGWEQRIYALQAFFPRSMGTQCRRLKPVYLGLYYTRSSANIPRAYPQSAQNNEVQAPTLATVSTISPNQKGKEMTTTIQRSQSSIPDKKCSAFSLMVYIRRRSMTGTTLICLGNLEQFRPQIATNQDSVFHVVCGIVLKALLE